MTQFILINQVPWRGQSVTLPICTSDPPPLPRFGRLKLRGLTYPMGVLCASRPKHGGPFKYHWNYSLSRGKEWKCAILHTAIVVRTLMWNTWMLETSLGWFMESVATKLLWLNSYKSTVEIYEINIIFVRVTLRFKKYMWLLNLSALNRHPPICKVSNLERSFMRDASMYKYLCVCRWNT